MLGEPPDLVPPINPGLKDGVLVKIVLTEAERIILGLRLLLDPAVERVVPYSGQRARVELHVWKWPPEAAWSINAWTSGLLTTRGRLSHDR